MAASVTEGRQAMHIKVKNNCSECGAACGGRKTCCKKCAAQRWLKRQKELPSQQYIKVQKKCLHCGAQSGRRLTCSKECEKQRREARTVLRESRCLECSTVLLSKAGNRKFCGKKCYLTNKRRNAEPIQLRFYSCTYCKKRFGRPGNRPYNYCSHACRNLDNRKQHTCKRCSKTFPHKRGGGKHMFCSRACSDRLLRSQRFAERRKNIRPRATAIYLINCTDCGILLASRMDKTRRCRECQAIHPKRLSFNKYGEIRQCKYCATSFGFSGESWGNYCGTKCRKLGKIAERKKNRRIDRHMRRKRFRENGTIERFDPHSIFERDGWRCQHCNRKTRPTYRVSHDLYPNLDHIVPVSKGGSHTRANVQLLCRACNLKKSDGLLSDQLLLIG